MFHVISDAENKNSISLSANHLINVKNLGYIHASKVKIGDILRSYSDEKQAFKDLIVSSIKFEFKTGYTAPLTNEGTVLVNGIDASCYAVVNNQYLANFVMIPLKAWYAISKYYSFGEANKNVIKSFVDVNWYSQVLYRFASIFMPSILT